MFRKSHVPTVVVLAVALLVGGGSEAQTTTGRIIGTVTDGGGQPLPDATITISSPALIGGEQTKTTGSDGGFLFIGLNPGDYTVKAELSSFISQERQEIKVPLGGAAALNITMPQATFESEIEVSTAAPVIDPTQVNTEQIFDYRYLQNAAVGAKNRFYQEVLGQAPGVTRSRNPNVYGSALTQNAYFIDGQDTTEPLTQTWGTLYNYDSIAELEFVTSGFEAEFGRATGGIVNLLTRSGGNQFNGTFDFRYRGDSFQEGGDHYDASSEDSSYQDYGATLGGPIVRDRLWFFVAYEYFNSETTPSSSPTTRQFKGTNYNGKLTWQVGQAWRLVAKFSGSPADVDNNNASQFVAPEATSLQKQNADVAALELNGVLTDSLVWNTVIGTYRGEFDRVPMSGDLVTPSHFNLTTFRTIQNFDNQQYSDRNRDDLATDLTWFVDGFGGSHEFKVGVQYSGTEVRAANCYTGTLGGACSPGSSGYSYVDLGTEEFPFPFSMYEQMASGLREYTGDLWTAYLQDSWRVLPSLTLKLGIRQDNMAYDNDLGEQVADFKKFQPRLGLAWDITNDAKNVLRADWGRFLDPASLQLPEILGTRNNPLLLWGSCMSLGPFFGITDAASCEFFGGLFGWSYRPDDPEGMDPWGWLLTSAIGEVPPAADSNLEPAYADAWSVSYEREVGRRTSVELSYVNKKTRGLFEDTCSGNLPDPSPDADCSQFVLANLPNLARDYQGLVLRFETRSFDWLTLLGSYTYSKSEGNLDLNFGESPAFDIYPVHWVNRYGYLPDHRLHQFKLNGFLYFKGDWTIGFDAFWSSAFTWQPVQNLAADPNVGYGFEYLEPRGSRDGDSAQSLDLQLGKGFTIGSTRLQLIGTVYNAFSNEYAIAVCEEATGCGGGIETGDPILWETPRSYEVGFRIEF